MDPVELLNYCAEHADRIYVREQLGGRWYSWSLSELPVRVALEHVKRWMQTGHIPIRIRDEGPPE